MDKIVPFLWFEKEAAEAAQFYCTVFKKSKILEIRKMPDGSVMTASFELDGQPFFALNGKQGMPFNDSVSFSITCDDQEEVDYYWNALTAGGAEKMCGWLQDKFGVTWQVVPCTLGQLLGDKDPKKAQRAMQAMFGMKKIDIAALKAAANAS